MAIRATITKYGLGDAICKACNSHFNLEGTTYNKNLIVDPEIYGKMHYKISSELSQVSPLEDGIKDILGVGKLSKVFDSEGNIESLVSRAAMIGGLTETAAQTIAQVEKVPPVRYLMSKDMHIDGGTGEELKFKFYWGMNDEFNALDEVWTPSRDFFKWVLSGKKNDTTIAYSMPTKLGWKIATLLGTVDIFKGSNFSEDVKKAMDNFSVKEGGFKFGPIHIGGEVKLNETSFATLITWRQNLENKIMTGDKIQKYLNNFSVYSVKVYDDLNINRILFETPPSALGGIEIKYDFSKIDENSYPLSAEVVLSNFRSIYTDGNALPW